jgi:hypothetical protein
MRVQTAAIIVASFLLSHVRGPSFYSFDRRGALEMTEAVDLVERAPESAASCASCRPIGRPASCSPRTAGLPGVDHGGRRVGVAGPDAAERDIESYLRTQVPLIADTDMRCAHREPRTG